MNVDVCSFVAARRRPTGPQAPLGIEMDTTIRLAASRPRRKSVVLAACALYIARFRATRKLAGLANATERKLASLGIEGSF